MPGDDEKPCTILRDEIISLTVERDRKKKEYDDKQALDIVFFIDLKDAEKVEYEALDLRILRLKSLAQEKGCGLVFE